MTETIDENAKFTLIDWQKDSGVLIQQCIGCFYSFLKIYAPELKMWQCLLGEIPSLRRKYFPFWKCNEWIQ